MIILLRILTGNGADKSIAEPAACVVAGSSDINGSKDFFWAMRDSNARPLAPEGAGASSLCYNKPLFDPFREACYNHMGKKTALPN